MSDPVVVVGAGPVGLTAALALSRQDVPVVLVEAEANDRVRPGSRAIVLMAPTLRRFERVQPGLGRSIADRGIQVRGYDAFYDDRQVFHIAAPEAPPLSLLGMGAVLPQRVSETLLMDACLERGVQFRWRSPVAEVHTDAHGATVELRSGERISTPYVLAADGARSVVRKSLGLHLEGTPDETPFVIVDVDEHPDGSTPTSLARFYYRHPRLDGRNVMHMPFAGGMRIDLQCLPVDDVEYYASPEGIRDWVSEVIDPWHAEHVQWVSSYRFHQSVARSYTDEHRRVLLAGEAAHLFAPWGGRGLNSGVIDATDAATAIAQALRADDPAAAGRIVERCAEDRRKWGLHNRDLSSRGLRRMRGTDVTTRLLRDAAARVAPVFAPAGAWLANGPTQVPMPRPGLGSLAWY